MTKSEEDSSKVDDELRLSREQYRSLFESSPVALWEQDLSGFKRLLEDLRTKGVTDLHAYLNAHPDIPSAFYSAVRSLNVNRKALELYRASSKEELLQNLDRVLSVKTPQSFISEMLSIWNGELEYEGDTENLRLDGEKIDVRIKWSVQPGFEQTFGRVTFYIQDITKHKQAESALRFSEEKFSKAFHTSPDVFLITRLSDGKIIDANASIERVLGYAIEEVIGKSTLELNIWENPQDRDRMVSLVSQNSQVDGLEAQFLHKKGRIITCICSSRMIDVAGEACLITIARDISDKKAMEEALQDSHARYHRLFQDSPVALWEEDFSTAKKLVDSLRGKGISDLHLYLKENKKIVSQFISALRILDVNRTSLEMFGVSTKEELQQVLLTPLAQDPPDNLIDEMLCILEHKQSYEGVGKAYVAEGKSIDIRLRWRVAPGFEDTYEKVLVFVQDITEQKRAEQALGESETMFRQLAETIHEVFWLRERDTGKMIYISPAYEEIWGRTRQSLYQNPRSFIDSIHPDDQSRVRAAQMQLQQHNIPFNEEYRIIQPSGAVRWVWARTYPVLDENGETCRYAGIAEDITDRKLSDEALRRSERRFRDITDAAGEYVWESDIQGRYTYVSRQIEEIFGVSVDEMIGRTPYEFMPPEEAARVRSWLLDYKAERRPFKNMEHCSIRTDGRIVWQLISGEPVFDAEGDFSGYRGVGQDITERKHAEEELRKLWRAVENSPVVIVITDINGNIEYANPFFTEVTGYSLEEARGQNPRILNSGRQSKAFYETMWNTVLSGNKWEGEFINRKKSGEIFYEEAAIAPVINEAGQVTNFVAIKRDVTERKLLEEKMVASQKLVDLGTLAAGIAHELNSPLQVITGSSQNLLKQMASDTPLDMERVQRNLEMINRNGWRSARIISSLLAYARATPGEIAANNLNDMVQDTLLLIEHQLETWSNISVRTDLSPDMPPLQCDRNQIVQVLVNLLTNARDSMPCGGEITIRTWYDQPEEKIFLQVSDNGEGIPEDIQARIFDPFFTTRPVGKGTGLGLSIVLGIVQAYGGEITVESRPKNGASFTMSFPTGTPLPSIPEPQGRFDG